MGKQEGLNQYSGRSGNTVYYQVEGEGRFRSKGGISKEQFETKPSLVNARRSRDENKEASLSAKTFSMAFQEAYVKIPNSNLHNLLMPVMTGLTHSDTVNEWGKRKAAQGNMDILKGFEFSKDARLDSLFTAPYTGSINRVTGLVELEIPAFDPRVMIRNYLSATQFRLFAAAAEVDFQSGKSIRKVDYSNYFQLNNPSTGPVTLSMQLTSASTLAIFLALGICFYQTLHGERSFPNKKGAFAMQVVGVDV